MVRVSAPPPPASVTGIEKVPEIEKESFLEPPVTVRLDTRESATCVAAPSTVTTMFSPESVTEMTCAASLETVTAHATGGEGPLPGTAAGSEQGRSTLAEVVVESLGLFAGVVLTVPPFVPEPEVPLPVAPAAVTCAL